MAGWKICFCVLPALLLAGCATFDYPYTPAQEQKLSAEILGNPLAEPPVSPLYLSGKAMQALDKRIRKGWGDRQKLDQLRDFLFDKNEMHLTYNAARTKTAMQVWHSRSGNCLSITNLFVAAARHVGLDAGFETVAVTPTWDQQGATMVRYKHIVAVGRLIGGHDYVVDFLPEFEVGDRKATRITDRQAMALYYNNLGAESVIAGQFSAAIENVRQAIRINPLLSDAWNNMGVALLRTKQEALAEFAYQRAVRLNTDNYSALNNLARFYQSEGEARKASYFIARIAAYRRRNPYYHYFVAHYLYEKAEYKKAIAVLDQAVRLKRNEPKFYAALAQSYEKLGRRVESRRYQALAKEYGSQQKAPAPLARNHRFWIQNE